MSQTENLLFKVLENHPQDSRMKIKEDGIFQTMGARMGGEGDPNTLMVMESRVRRDDTPMTTDNKQAIGADLYNQTITGDTAATISSDSCITSSRNGPYALEIEETKQETSTVVRRLTPLECERLQGYPDGWTDIGEWIDSKGKKHKDSDTPRYKALGNSIALPFWQWMAQRICDQYDRPIQMASLFDGIGGFPLVFSRCGAEPIWASEIEEFPIAVTKVRFKEGEEDDSNRIT